MTAPFAAHGVGTERRTTAAAGMRASISESVSCGARDQPGHAYERRRAVERRREFRDDEAAATVTGEDDLPRGGRSRELPPVRWRSR